MNGMLSLDQLRAEVAAGTLDTVLVAVPDMQERLQGKRLDAGFFLDEVATHGTEACSYLLAVDVEMHTVDGYRLAAWERGCGDFAMRPDLATMWRVPWHRAGLQ
jgi:glutamine synthetase